MAMEEQLPPGYWHWPTRINRTKSLKIFITIPTVEKKRIKGPITL